MEMLYPGFDRDYADSLSKKFELDTLKKNNKLSTGQSTMMKLILCLASSASVLLLDEPSSA
jgi:ABC-type multidrug transport system ATPase subunit